MDWKTFLQPIYKLWHLSERKRSPSVAPVSAHSSPRHRDIDASAPPIQPDETVITQTLTLTPLYPSWSLTNTQFSPIISETNLFSNPLHVFS